MKPRRLHDRDSPLWLVILTVGAFLVAYHAPVHYTASDPRGTLLTAQALVEHGSPKLDDYSGVTYVPAADSAGTSGSFRTHHGHCYYYFPVGTSVLAAPFVWLATLRGESMLLPATDDGLQNLLSAMTVGGAMVLSYLLCAAYVPPTTSLLLSAVFVYGGPLMSTMGTALWSANAATLFVLASLLLLARGVGVTRRRPILFAVCLWAAFLCRPTTGLYGAVSMIYLMTVSRAVFARAAATLAVLTSIWILWSRLEYGTLVPSYFEPGRLGENTVAAVAGVLLILLAGWGLRRRLLAGRHRTLGYVLIGVAVVALILIAVLWARAHQRLAAVLGTSLLGVWASPGRGLLVYSPYLLVTGVGLFVWRTRMVRDPMLWIACGSLALHTLLAGRWTRWWGGHCFGSRLMTEAYPLAMILTVLTWRQWSTTPSRGRRWITSAMVVASMASVFINTYQGLYNPLTTIWNASPDIDEYPDYVLDWRYPQFLASPTLLAAREHDHAVRHARKIAMKALPPYAIGESITALSGAAYFEGWSPPSIDARGLSCREATGQASIYLWVQPVEPSDSSLAVEAVLAVDRGATLTVSVNGTPAISSVCHESGPHAWVGVFDAALLHPARPVIIGFSASPHAPTDITPRLRFYGLGLRAATSHRQSRTASGRVPGS